MRLRVRAPALLAQFLRTVKDYFSDVISMQRIGFLWRQNDSILSEINRVIRQKVLFSVCAGGKRVAVQGENGRNRARFRGLYGARSFSQ